MTVDWPVMRRSWINDTRSHATLEAVLAQIIEDGGHVPYVI